MRRKAAMLQLQKPAKQTKKKTAGKHMKEKKNREKENKDKVTEERDVHANKVNKEEMAKKKAERQKKQADKEKAKEEKAREKAQKERTALMERDNRVLSKMATFTSHLRSSEECSEGSELLLSDEEDPVILEQDLDDCFNGNDIVSLISDEYLNDTPSRASHLDQSATNVVNSAKSTLALHPTQASTYSPSPTLALHSSSMQASTCSSRHPFQPRQSTYQNSDTSQTPRSTVGGKRPRSWKNLSIQPDATRPAVGGKRPRASFQPLSEDDNACTKCDEYKQLILRKDAEIAQLKAQGNNNYLDMIIEQVGIREQRI